MNDVDVVLTYVDNTDPVWRQSTMKWNSEYSSKRYRSWENLMYLFRGIHEFMPFVRKVHVVVSNIEQIPQWMNKDEVNVVLHKDIIPEDQLPTFNSTTIEMFISKIPGLQEKFIYFNDDMFPNRMMSEHDFFRDGKPVYSLMHRDHARNTFRMQCRNSYMLAADLTGAKYSRFGEYFYVKHSPDPMLKSVCLEVLEKAHDKILWSLSRFREPFNYTQYLFPIYTILKNKHVEDRIDFTYYNACQYDQIVADLSKSISKSLCINDSGMCDFNVARNAINRCLAAKFPKKSRFEI